MIRKIFFTIIIFISWNNAIAQAPSESTGWKLSKKKNGISVYTRDHANSDIKEFSGTGIIHTSTKLLNEVFEDIGSNTKWVYGLKCSIRLKRINENEAIEYHELMLPWPFSNRDLIFIFHQTTDPRTGSVHNSLVSKYDYIPEKEGIVRMKIVEGFWHFKPVGNGDVEVTYQFFGDPAGYVPAWLVNLFIVTGPYETLLNLREYVKEKK